MKETVIIAQTTACLTIGDTTYKTAGNIVFSSEEGTNYFLAESAVLEKLDKAIQKGIVENGMQSLMRKFKA
jgi:hypothetical protein